MLLTVVLATFNERCCKRVANVFRACCERGYVQHPTSGIFLSPPPHVATMLRPVLCATSNIRSPPSPSSFLTQHPTLHVCNIETQHPQHFLNHSETLRCICRNMLEQQMKHRKQNVATSSKQRLMLRATANIRSFLLLLTCLQQRNSTSATLNFNVCNTQQHASTKSKLDVCNSETSKSTFANIQINTHIACV
jgi:hypothetical protein